MAWKSTRAKIDWRRHLTRDEAKLIAETDRALADLDKARAAYDKKFGTRRMKVVNRAIQRAKFNCAPRCPQENASE